MWSKNMFWNRKNNPLNWHEAKGEMWRNAKVMTQRRSITCGEHGEQQQSGGVERLSCHEEGPRIGVGAHRLRCPAEGKHQTQGGGAQCHQRGENRKHPLGFHGWGKSNVLVFTLDHCGSLNFLL